MELSLYQGAVLFYYSQRGREGRLIRLLSDTRRSKHGVDWGIGIDENTALVVSHVGTHLAKAEVYITDNKGKGITPRDIPLIYCGSSCRSIFIILFIITVQFLIDTGHYSKIMLSYSNLLDVKV